MAFPGNPDEIIEILESQKAYLAVAKEFGELQSLCGRLRRERNAAVSKLVWLEEKLRKQGLWTSLVKQMETELSDG